MRDIITNIINAIIVIVTTIVIAILSTQKRTDKFLNAFNKHRIRNIVLATTFFIVIVGVYASNFYFKKTGNLEQSFIVRYDEKVENIVRLKDRISQLDTENKSLQISYQLIKTRLDSVGKLLATKQNQKDDLTRQIDQKETAKSRLNAQLQNEDPRNVAQTNALNLKITQLETEIQKLTREREQLEKEIEKLEAEKKDLNQKNEDLKNSLVNSNRERQELESRLKKEHDIYATRIAQSDSIISLLSTKQDQSKLTHQIAWSPDKKWLAILYSYGKISRLLVIDVNSRTGILDTLIQKSYQHLKFSPDGEKILLDMDIFYLKTQSSAKPPPNPESGKIIKPDDKIIQAVNKKDTSEDISHLPEKPQISMRTPQDTSKSSEIQAYPPSPVKVTLFRSQPKTLSADEVKSMLKKYDFCDIYKNPNSRGFANQYQPQTIQGDKVVIDQASGLMWQQSGSDSYFIYDTAIKWIDDLNKKGCAGYYDWRLPTLEEAMSLMEPKVMNGDLYIDPAFDKTQRWIWTADKGASRWWVVGFYSGRCFEGSGFYNYVRLVRSGHSLSGR